jgi:hypothetical protein
VRGGPDESIRVPARLDLKNLAIGAVVSAVLVGILCYETLSYVQTHTPREEGVNIGGAMLAEFGSMVAIALGAAFTARRARRRGSQPFPEGIGAGLTGFTLATCTFVTWFLFEHGAPFEALFEIPEMLPLLLPGAAAALAGAALGSSRRNRGQTR